MTTVTTSVGSPGTVSAASGGDTRAFNNISTTPQQVLGIAAQRRYIVFHNPGTIDIFVAQVFVQNTGSDVALSPTPSTLGGCFLVYANGGSLRIEGECQKAWQAFSRSASSNPLTIVVGSV